ncbi:MAG TPA: CCA tRNA nucleotidyltransferase [Chloroflexia bacterium]|nr:CCA tRNA nucleotidyltransferase [Chloroflexia bacterium]
MTSIPQDPNAHIREQLPVLLPMGAVDLLHDVAREAEDAGSTAFLEGGSVRDCLLDIPSDDIDVSVVGDAPALARKVAGKAGAKVDVHSEFGTATLLFDGNPFTMDIVTSRRERYERPGALPLVEPASIEEDLARRDFTVNAMAVPLMPDGFGDLLDPKGGVTDLSAGLIRVLHDQSFEDDPTRIFRAAKLAVRLGFEIERHTLELILLAVRDSLLSNISMDRVTRELLLIMQERKGSDVMALLDKLGVLGNIYPELAWPFAAGAMEPVQGDKQARLETHLAALAIHFAGKDAVLAEGLARFLRMPLPLIKLMRDAVRLMAVWDNLGGEELAASQVYRLLQPLNGASLEAVARINPSSHNSVEWDRLHLYLTTLRYVKLAITGDHLRKLGIEAGPIYREVLDASLDARLDGKVATKADEERFVREWLASRNKTT